MSNDLPNPEGIWFGQNCQQSFAMLHRPAAASEHGVVICNGFGFEGLTAHRPLRHLATSLANHGRTVLRVDYPGTGDAPQDGHGPEQLGVALDAINDAVTILRDHEGCRRVSLVGIRAGATLACLYGIKNPGIEDLVLWAPCERGSLYVRELKATNRLSAASRIAAVDPGDRGGRLEVVGFEFSPALLADLAEIDMSARLTDAPARRVLVLERDNVPVSQAVLDSLTATGTQLTCETSVGWADFMVSDETNSVLPQSSLDAISSWMCDPTVDREAPAAMDPRTSCAPPTVVSKIEEPGFREHTTWIDGRLFAVVTEPGQAAGSAAGTNSVAGDPGGRPFVIMPNTGSVNRTGPGRLYTHLARHWAGLGFTVVRFDLAGTGDTPAAPGEVENAPYVSSRLDDLLDVIQWAKKSQGAGEVNLFGICSGAYQSFHVPLLGAKVRRVILVNQAIFYLGPDDTVSTSTSKAMIASHNLWRISFIRSKVTRALRSPGDLTQFARRAWRGVGYSLGAWLRRVMRGVGIELSEREHLARDLVSLAHSNVDVHLIYSTGEPGVSYLRAFGGHAFATGGGPHSLTSTGRGLATILEIDGGDHIFSPPAARRELIATATDYILANDSKLSRSETANDAPIPK